MQLTKLYKRTSHGKIQTWTIEIDEPNAQYRSISGYDDSDNKVTSEWTRAKAKNTGKANETSAKEQAIKEAKAKHRLKLEGEYRESIAELGKTAADVGYIKPMLAKEYSEHKDKLKFPVWVDRKYNGMRMIATVDGLFSRNGNPVLSAPHIIKVLKPIFDKHPNLVLDGEGYHHQYRHKLNRIISLLRREKPTEDELKESEDIVEYHIYDAYGFNDITRETKFSIRKAGLSALLKDIPNIFIVKSDKASNEQEMDSFYKQYLEEEYEGMMVRIDGSYQNKRSDGLLKRKDFIQEEFKIIDIVEGEGNRTGTAGAAICELSDGRTFRSNIKGDEDHTTEILVNKSKYIGKMGMIKFFAYTEYGVPQFPYLISTRLNNE